MHRLQLTDWNPVRSADYEHPVDQLRQLNRVLLGDRLVFTLDHSLVKSSHVLCLERQVQAGHFVGYATNWPHITLEIVGFIPPYLWWCIVRCARLGIVETILASYLRNVEITDFHNVVICEKDVGWLSRKELYDMKRCENIPLSLDA